jgi:hypothetical protein
MRVNEYEMRDSNPNIPRAPEGKKTRRDNI